MELNKRHVFSAGTGSIAHRQTISRSDTWVGGVSPQSSNPSCGEDDGIGLHRVNTSVLLVKAPCSRHTLFGASMFTLNQIYRKGVGSKGYVWIRHGFGDEGPFDLSARCVLRVKNSRLGVPSFFGQRKFSMLICMKVDTDFNEVLNTLACLADDRANNRLIARSVPRTEGVFDVSLDGVDVVAVKNCSDASLGPIRGRIFGPLLCYYNDLMPGIGQTICSKKTSNATADDHDLAHRSSLLEFATASPSSS